MTMVLKTMIPLLNQLTNTGMLVLKLHCNHGIYLHYSIYMEVFKNAIAKFGLKRKKR